MREIHCRKHFPGSARKWRPPFGNICTSLREEDWDLFLQTLGHLGYLDAKMQIQLLESGRTELAMREEKLRHQLPEQKRVWQSLGILGGAFLVVILI